MSKNKKPERSGKIKNALDSKALGNKLQMLVDELKLNIALADLGDIDSSSLVKILRTLTTLKGLCDEEGLHLFSRATSTIHGIVSCMIVDEGEFYKGISNVIKLSEVLEEAIERFLFDGKVPESFKKHFNNATVWLKKKKPSI